MSQIEKNFILCIRPYTYNLSADQFIIIPGSSLSCAKSYVRLTEIKTVHEFKLDLDLDCCYFYTYKDEWYICFVSAKDLIDIINKS